MSSQDNMTQTNEISLVDLFIVIIKRRRLFGLALILALILAIGAYFTYPVFKFGTQPVKNYSSEIRINVTPIPDDLRSFLGIDTQAMLSDSLTNPRIVGEVFKTVYPEISKGSDERFNAFIRNDIIGKRLVLSKPTPNVTVTFTGPDAEKSEQFLTLLYNKVLSETKTRADSAMSLGIATLDESMNSSQMYVANMIELSVNKIANTDSVNSLDNLFTSINSSISPGLQGLSEITQKKTRIENLKGNAYFPYALEGSVIVMDLSPNASRTRVQLSIMIMIGGFFLAILLAFLFEYIDYVRHNSVFMQKIRDALAWRSHNDK